TLPALFTQNPTGKRMTLVMARRPQNGIASPARSCGACSRSCSSGRATMLRYLPRLPSLIHPASRYFFAQDGDVAPLVGLARLLLAVVLEQGTGTYVFLSIRHVVLLCQFTLRCSDATQLGGIGAEPRGERGERRRASKTPMFPHIFRSHFRPPQRKRCG